MSIIPQDIITTHILRRLPSKSIGRFRCVSKQWLSLLTEPRFIQLHQKTLNKNEIIVGYPEFSSYWPYSTSQTKLRLGLFDLDGRHGSVNGLVLGSNHIKSLEVYTLTVLNPTTGHYVELPFHKQVDVFGMLGIGYDSVTDDYKVVNITFTDDNHRNNNVYVYSLRTNTWKQVTDLPYNHHDKRLPGVFVNGFLHWIVIKHSDPVIVAFSLADEKFRELPSPNLHNEIDLDTRLVALGEKLAMFNLYKSRFWLMNEYGVQKSWTKIVVPGFDEIPMVRNWWDDAPTTTVFCKNGKVLFLTSGLLWIFDLEEQTFCKSIDISYRVSYRNMKGNYVNCAFVESLVSPKFSRSG